MKQSAASFALILVAAVLASCGAQVPQEPRAKKESAAVRPAPSPAPAASQASHPVDSASVASVAATNPGTAAPADSGARTAAHARADSAAGSPGPVTIATSVQMPFNVPVTFEVEAIAMRDTVRLRSEALSDAAGFACQPAAAGSSSAMSVLRFAHFGRSDSPYAMKWVLYLPNGEGTLTARPATGDQRGGYEVTLRGPLEFDMILRGATKPLRLGPRMVPEFTGYSRTWPPKGGTVLTLSNGPVPFFVLNGAAPPPAPMLTVLQTRFTFGSRATGYISQPPRILQAQLLDSASRPWKKGPVGGLRIEWASSAEAARPVNISGYNVYRMATGGSWQRIASLPAEQTSYVDLTYDGRSAVQYAVTHRSEYPTGFEFEGILSAPVSVARVQ
ncbi:MAG TPA: hypothetical protein VHI13_22510 [Candidatus Kapabacteria bacterium]|nr:hypothetical protein [Candidatus Kapabacteria bacterium]